MIIYDKPKSILDFFNTGKKFEVVGEVTSRERFKVVPPIIGYYVVRHLEYSIIYWNGENWEWR